MRNQMMNQEIKYVMLGLLCGVLLTAPLAVIGLARRVPRFAETQREMAAKSAPYDYRHPWSSTCVTHDGILEITLHDPIHLDPDATPRVPIRLVHRRWTEIAQGVLILSRVSVRETAAADAGAELPRTFPTPEHLERFRVNAPVGYGDAELRGDTLFVRVPDDWLARPRAERERELETMGRLWTACLPRAIPPLVKLVDAHDKLVGRDAAVGAVWVER